MKIAENFYNLDLFRNDKKELVAKIYQLKRSYIYVLEMNQELNDFMFVTISTMTICGFMWILTRLYQLYQIFAKGVELNEVFGKLGMRENCK